MLVLSRKKGESIIIGDTIEITLLEVDADTVKIGIQAPRDIEVLRKEIYTSVKEANLEAAAPAVQLDLKQLQKSLSQLKKNEDRL